MHAEFSGALADVAEVESQEALYQEAVDRAWLRGKPERNYRGDDAGLHSAVHTDIQMMLAGAYR